MKQLKVDLSLEELTLLAGLAADQLFRREFIDPKMPGYKHDPAEVHLGKALVVRLRTMIAEACRDTESFPVTVTVRARRGGVAGFSNTSSL